MPVALHHLPFSVEADKVDPVNLLQGSDGQVLAHGQRQEQRLLLAILRDQANAELNRIERRANFDLLAFEGDRALFKAVSAEDRTRGFCAACADQPGNAEDLAATHLEADAMEGGLVVGIIAISHRAQIVNSQDDIVL